MKKLLSYSIVLFVLTIILLLIIPLPAGLVDVAIILNMSLSLMILVITMTIREPLEFSIFPSLLLITTLFRLGINVSTTRNILSNSGSSGQIIQAFGDFVLQGNVVVGMVIYMIIVLMQFIALNDPIGSDKEGNQITLLETLGSDGTEILDTVESKDDERLLHLSLKGLSPKERYIIIQRYGLCGAEEHTQREIAKQLGISRSYVSRIEKKALQKLHKSFEE